MEFFHLDSTGEVPALSSVEDATGMQWCGLNADPPLFPEGLDEFRNSKKHHNPPEVDTNVSGTFKKMDWGTGPDYHYMNEPWRPFNPINGKGDLAKLWYNDLDKFEYYTMSKTYFRLAPSVLKEFREGYRQITDIVDAIERCATFPSGCAVPVRFDWDRLEGVFEADVYMQRVVVEGKRATLDLLGLSLIHI